jgi:hypothetical protein
MKFGFSRKVTGRVPTHKDKVLLCLIAENEQDGIYLALLTGKTLPVEGIYFDMTKFVKQGNPQIMPEKYLKEYRATL